MNKQIIIQIPDKQPDKYLDMPDGLEGYWWETDNQICVPLVIAKKAGAFSKFLKEIERKGKIVFFPTIISAKLDAILRARGYKETETIDETFGFVDGLALQGEMPKEVK